MRLTTSRWLPILVIAAAVVLVAALISTANGPRSSPQRATDFVSASANGERKSHVKPETRRELGRFHLESGGVSLSTADAVDGGACLVEDDENGDTSSCLDGGLFATRKAELIVSSDGGPERYDHLHVAGVVAPGVRSAWLVKTDGTSVELVLNASGAFAYESPDAELGARVYPTAVRLYGPSGKFVGSVDFPAAG